MTLKEEQQWLDSWGCLGLGAHWPPVSRNVPVVNDNDNCYDNYTNTQTQDQTNTQHWPPSSCEIPLVTAVHLLTLQLKIKENIFKIIPVNIISSVRSSYSHPDLQLIQHPTHFFRSRRSSTLDFHFLSHYSYIKAIMLYKGKTWQYSGILWHTMAHSGILWHTLAYSGILLHTLASSDIH